MKTTSIKVYGVKSMVYGIAVAMLLVLSGAAYATAPTYQNTYKGTMYKGQGTMYNVQSTAPAMGFQSTSAYAGQWENGSITPMLNADGSVNGGAYMGAPSRPRKDETNINNPTDPDEEEDDGNSPLGDGMLPLMLLAFAYALCAIYKVSRRRKA